MSILKWKEQIVFIISTQDLEFRTLGVPFPSPVIVT